MNELEYAYRSGRSMESLPKDAGRLEYVGKNVVDKRIYLYYRDALGSYWYKNKIITPQGIVSEYEAVFGHRRRKNEQSNSDGETDKGPQC